jgi:ribose-phosphate pyrophosphokinase
MDAHSDVAAACINKFGSSGQHHTIAEFFKSYEITGEYYLVAPDAGAMKKIYKAADKVGYTGKILVCMKHRDEATGKITSTEIVFPEGYNKTATLVIVDDICDGGRTFIEIAKAARTAGHIGKIYLVVTHGIFSNGYEELRSHLDGVFCTNSVKDVDTTWFDGYNNHPTGVRQYDVFA